MISHITLNTALEKCGSAERTLPSLFGKITIDSRAAVPGDIFLAFEGEKIDGHSFIDALIEKNVFCIGTRPASEYPAGWYAGVRDVQEFLWHIARETRKKITAPVIALTGSSGKTSTRELIAAMLRKTGSTVWSASGNLNNHLGMPIVLSNIPFTADYCVLELGMNHAGEIAALAGIARPDIAVITNIGTAHIGNFSSRAGVANAKLELFDSSSGTIIANLDNPFISEWVDTHPDKKCTTFSFSGGPADFLFEISDTSRSVILKYNGNTHLFTFQGEIPSFMIENICTAAVTVMVSASCGPEKIFFSPSSITFPRYRGERVQKGERVFVMDCYNANPDSMGKSIESFLKTNAESKLPLYLILGSMAELGAFSAEFHYELIKRIQTHDKVTTAFLVGNEFEKVAPSFFDDEKLVFCGDLSTMVHELPQNGIFLVKGSRAAGLEQILSLVGV